MLHAFEHEDFLVFKALDLINLALSALSHLADDPVVLLWVKHLDLDSFRDVGSNFLMRTKALNSLPLVFQHHIKAYLRVPRLSFEIKLSHVAFSSIG